MRADAVDAAMAAHAARAVTVAAEGFGVSLDGRAASIDALEALLGRYARDLPRGPLKLVRRRPSSEAVGDVVRMFGAYLGEVMRAELGGAWHLRHDAEGREVAELHLPGGVCVSPPDIVHRRMTVGGEYDVAHWYGVVCERVAAAAPAAD